MTLHPANRRRPGARRHLLAIGLAGLASWGCKETPDPPDACGRELVSRAELEWRQPRPLPVAGNLDSLRTLVLRTGERHARRHLVSEYLLAANRLQKGARDSALAALERAIRRDR